MADFTEYDRLQDHRINGIDARLDVHEKSTLADFATLETRVLALEAAVKKLEPLSKLLWLVSWK